VGNAWSRSDWTTLYPQILDRYFQEVQALYAAGARQFLFLTVPPIYLTPSVISQGNSTQEGEKAAIKQYNDLLGSKAAAFKAKNTDTTVTVYDTTQAFLGPLQNPALYGAADATCFSGTGTSCLWFNDCEFFGSSLRRGG
jgi:phospholipase/lecithinase/hemolysin